MAVSEALTTGAVALASCGGIIPINKTSNTPTAPTRCRKFLRLRFRTTGDGTCLNG